MKRKLKDSFKNAFFGIGYAFITQRNLRIQCFLGVIAIILSIILKLSLLEWLLVISAIIGVIIAELINTTIELTIDLIIQVKNKRAQFIKDISAGIVLLISLWSIILGIVVFIPKIIGVFG